MPLFKLTDEQIKEIATLVEGAKGVGHQPSHDGHWRRLQSVIDAYSTDPVPRFSSVTANNPRLARAQAKAYEKAQEEIGKAIDALEKITKLRISVSVPLSSSDAALIPDDASPICADALELLESLNERYEKAKKREELKDSNPGKKLPAKAREPLVDLILWWREATGEFPGYSNANEKAETNYGKFGMFLEVLGKGPKIPVLDHFFGRNKAALTAAIKEAKERYKPQN